ncbi:hypothetical protein FACS1894176_05190 [Bacteroidia bacterium]|nr:hypothetical protein FACS1894176_05190 [Bacteroidia bacterium]
MKKISKVAFLLLAVIGMSVMAFAPQDEKVVAVDKTVHDFGTIVETAGKVSAIFVVTNKTNAPIVLTNVRSSCGCTTPDWTKTPIEPGKTGTVTATYDPAGRPGPFEKTVTISTSGNPDRLLVRIKGTVE